MDKTEQARRKLFIKAAHDVYKIWPEYNAPLPAPRNKTDRCAHCETRYSLADLKKTWNECRAGRADEDRFREVVTRWAADRIYNAMILGLVNKYGESIK